MKVSMIKYTNMSGYVYNVYLYPCINKQVDCILKITFYTILNRRDKNKGIGCWIYRHTLKISVFLSFFGLHITVGY
jgi:hypothetical protein